MKSFAKPNTDHPGKLILAGVLALGAAYIFASLAIDRGNWAYYSLAFVGIYFGVKYIWHGVRTLRK